MYYILYDLVFFLFSLFYLPYFLFRKKFHLGFQMRLGILPKGLKLNSPIWMHAVSVGEAMAVRGLLEELRGGYPDKRFIISTVTSTGNRIAKDMAKDGDFVTYLPLDLSFIVRSVIDRINPSIFIIAETELWPNLITYLYQRHIPIIVVNGRISDNSFRGYLAIKFLIKSILNKISLYCVQTNRDASRLISLGVSEDKIKITGNMKFDASDYADFKNLPAAGRDYTDSRVKLGLDSKEKLLVAGSTHPGEEEIILGVYKELAGEFTDLRLLIAPRHPERWTQIEKSVIKYNFKPVRISQLLQTPNTCDLKPVFILDTVGQLINYYAIAEVVFVGGSLVRIGGHNILEPASQDKPVIFGPYMFNFRDIVELFLKNNAAILIHNQEELKTNIKYLLNNPYKITQLCQRAKGLILQNQGATRRNVEYIKEELWSTGRYG